MEKKIYTVREAMEEMQSINLSNLKNPVHREFINDTLIEARKHEAVVQNLARQVAALAAAYDEEMQASVIEETVQRLTEEVEGEGGSGGPADGNGGNGGSTGGNQKTLTFTFHSGEVQIISGATGEDYTMPANTAGYVWSSEKSMLPTIPTHDFRFIEVPEGVELYLIVWYPQGLNPVQWYQLPEGFTIPAAPEPPAGREWQNYPATIPTRDLDIFPRG